MTVPDSIKQMVDEISAYLDSQGYDDVRVEITSKGVFVQRKDIMKAHSERRFRR